MSVNLDKLKKLFSVKNITSSDSPNHVEESPQIGFKISYCEFTKQLKVKVIGARHLPTVYGTTRPMGYIVKVCINAVITRYMLFLVKSVV